MKNVVLLGIIVSALTAAGLVLATAEWAAGDESVASKVENSMAEEAAKPRFNGTMGDFEVLPRTEDALAKSGLFSCKSGAATVPVSRVDAMAAAGELWSDAFATEEGAAWGCQGEGILLVNNQGMSGETTTGEDVLLIRGYFSDVPVPVLRDAPKDRLELTEVEGHPALLEHPIDGYPYGQANLVVIERFPTDGAPGIVVVVERAASAKRAIELAEELIP